ncbi:MAG: GGDEF domain-containing phosphodiesterase, partial [Pseudomonadota bacterium]|nr:GGDEF domain-containing phosphodiesterase [Pseudomonadota bacterium]
GMTHPDAIEPVVRRMVRAFAEPFDIEGHSVTVGASAGITLVPRDGDEQDAILRKADLALYQAKAAGRGTHRFFEPQMQLRLLTRRALEADLRAAVKDKAFEIHYQPVVQLESGSPIGFEALLRWRHKERGMLLPSDFIPIAEDSGLIVPIGAWVLARACADAMTWRDDLKLAVNLSSAQFRAGDIVGAVTAALNASRLDPRRLELEINEFVLLGQSDRNLTMLNEIERLGCSIIMDDFGTGFSSLSHLRAFPIGTIKIDRSFVPDMSSKPEHIEIIRAVLALGKSLGKRVIAEGIESEAQLALLLKLGCKEGQGLYFGAPEPASSISRLLKRTGARAPVAISGRMG